MKIFTFISVPCGGRFALLAALALSLTNASFGADTLKPRSTIKKPKSTVVDRTGQFADRISVKGGSSSWTGTLSKPLTLNSYSGVATIGP